MFASLFRVIKDFTESLIDKYKGMMMRLSYSITGNYQDAEDVVQEAFFVLSGKQKILRDLDSDDAKNYIYTVTKNRAIRLCKKKTVDVTYLNEEEFVQIEGEPDINAFVDELGFGDEITNALKGFSPEDHDLICYYYGFGYSYNEIGKLMDIAPATLRQRMLRCRKRLTSILERD